MSEILIWGAGAIGGSIGAALAHAGHDVLLVDRAADHVAAINRSGLEITGPIRQYTVRAGACTPEQVEGAFQTVFLCVKAQDTEAAAQALAPHLAQDGVVVSAQNGLNERVIARIVGEARTIGCFVNFGADYHGPGLVMYGGRGALVVGELDGRRSARIETIHRLFRAFDDDAVLTDNIWGYLWSKLIYGALLFATALTDDSIADVLDAKRYRPVLAALGQEVAAVAAAERVRLEPFDGFDPAAFTAGASAATLARSFADMVAFNRRSAKSHSGIWRDLAVRRRRTEIDAQIGPIVEIGDKHGVATPRSARLIALIHDIEDGRRVQAWATLDALAAAHEGADEETAA
ncbi:MAG: ketopantoate reductase family protein [Geminicoccaceae bacterium]